MPESAASKESQHWFIPDRAIEAAEADHLDHQALAGVMVEAIRAAKAPATIGLLGGFGTGKSSIGNLVIAEFKNDRGFDVVRVSADKHSGVARARNLVHSVAGEVEEIPGIDRKVVSRITQTLRASVQRSVLDLTDTPATRAFTEGYRWSALAPPALFWLGAIVLSVGLLIGSAFLSGGPGRALAALTGLPLIALVAYLLVPGVRNYVKAFTTPGTKTEGWARAEAADDVELVFAQLVDHHDKKRPKHQLVVIVDDVDRLSAPDLLDALRAIKSLQAVPKGAEPIFVLACDEEIVRSAIEHAGPQRRPAQSDPAGVPATPSVIDHSGEDAQPRELAARAFLDKLFTVRVSMPPLIEDDMRAFAKQVLSPSHPIRSSGVDVDRILAVLVHEGVDDPRSAIRLLNRFFASYLLARAREASEHVQKGDITDHAVVLARLCVLADEYQTFHAHVIENPILLEAADRLAQKGELSEGQAEAVRRAGIAVDVEDPAPASEDGDVRLVWNPDGEQELRRFLLSTSRGLTYPNDMAALVFFAQSAGGRRLGGERRGQIRSLMRSGEGDQMRALIEATPEDLRDAVALELTEHLRRADAVDADNSLSAVVPALEVLGDDAELVAAAAADLLEGSPMANPGAEIIATLTEHADTARGQALCERMVSGPDGEDAADRNDRLATAAGLAGRNPQLRPFIEPAVVSWLDVLPSEGGWQLAPAWLDVVEGLDLRPQAFGPLASQSIVPTVVRLVRAGSDFTSDQADRILAVARHAPPADPAPMTQTLANLDPKVALLADFGTRMLDAIESTETIASAWFLARAAEAPDTAPDARFLAADRVAGSVEVWAEGTFAAKDDEDPEPLAPSIIGKLATAATRDPLVAGRVAGHLDLLAAHVPDEIAPLAAALLDSVDDQLADDERQQAEAIADGLAASLDDLRPADQAPTSDRLWTPLVAGDIDPDLESTRSRLNYFALLAQTKAGTESLERAASQFADALNSGALTDRRTSIQALQRINQLHPGAVQGVEARVLTQFRAVPTSSLGDDQLRSLATFPWSDGMLAQVLPLLDQVQDAVPADALFPMLSLVARAVEAGQHDSVPSGLTRRLTDQVEADPTGPAVKIAADAWSVFSDAERERVTYASASRSGAIDDVLAGLGSEEAASLLTRSRDGDAASRLLGALPIANRSTTAVLSLHQLAAGRADEGVIKAVVAAAEVAPLSSFVEEALASLPVANPETESILRIAAFADERQVAINVRAVDTAAAQLLPQATPVIAGLLGFLLRGKRRMTDATRDALRELRNSEQGAAVAEAFDSARRNRG